MRRQGNKKKEIKTKERKRRQTRWEIIYWNICAHFFFVIFPYRFPRRAAYFTRDAMCVYSPVYSDEYIATCLRSRDLSVSLLKSPASSMFMIISIPPPLPFPALPSSGKARQLGCCVGMFFLFLFFFLSPLMIRISFVICLSIIVANANISYTFLNPLVSLIPSGIPSIGFYQFIPRHPHPRQLQFQRPIHLDWVQFS